ncbi:hypothetical protein [Curtobacterium flaccumfaciens]|uniref:hypothetical protein n=1 Tax=Curtobacterium flaccumfaciens TaxID=2035 RepID=UPI001E3FA296|nr:hypothetical protein [Curtobacterium allii]MCE0458433.1 hypothetical protein [Curtobacterium allii]
MFGWLDIEKTRTVPGATWLVEHWCVEHADRPFARSGVSPEQQRQVRLQHARLLTHLMEGEDWELSRGQD